MSTEASDVTALWPHGPPSVLEGVGPQVTSRGGAVLRNVSEPTLRVFRPQTPNGVGVIVCPGGGWRILTMAHEGIEAAHWLTALGYTVFLLKYRLHATPAADADYDAWEAALV